MSDDSLGRLSDPGFALAPIGERVSVRAAIFLTSVFHALRVAALWLAVPKALVKQPAST